MKRCIIALCVAAATSAHAAGPTVVEHLDNYACAQLNATETQMLNPHGPGIFILTAPHAGAPVGTMAPSIVFVRKPEHVLNGFVEVLQITGQPGWIEADKIKPMDHFAQCIPSRMSNGRIGAG